MNRILIVDDDESVIASLTLLLKQAGMEPVGCADPESALVQLNETSPDLVIQDMNFSRDTSGEEGLALLAQIRDREPLLPVVLLTAWGSISLAVAGIKAGASDFMIKPWDNERMLQVVRTGLSLADSAPSQRDREALDESYDFGNIIGRDSSLLKVLTGVARVADTDAGVLILGESGTGKELIAEAIHTNSARRDGPLIRVNLGAIPPSLFESEMFGHVRGAFTDARSDRSGHFAEADGGTLFLDEVGELDRSSQVKLLRVLADRQYQPVGAERPRRSDFRVAAATNADLAERVASGAFREDLYYRLNLITLNIPPLRARRGDISLIAAHHLSEIRARYGLAQLSISSGALRWLERQRWPGNVRQLKHTLERTALLAGGGVLEEATFVANAQDGSEPERPVDWPPVGQMTLDQVEAGMVAKAMAQFDHNVTRAAEALGLSRAALYRRLEKHQIPVEPECD